MATLLHILIHPKPDHSTTTQLANTFLDAYREAHPDDEIVVLDLYRETIPYLAAVHISAAGKQQNPDTMTPEERQAWDDVLQRIRQLRAADKILVSTPMWNFSVPAILKAYIDLVMQAGQTFRYTEIGVPVGMLGGKRMVIINTRGGVYSQPPMSELEMCVHYLRNVFGFMGVEVVTEIIVEGMALVSPDQQQTILAPALAHAREAGKML